MTTRAVHRLVLCESRAAQLREPLDAHVAVANADLYEEEAIIAVVESTEEVRQFVGKLEVRATRLLPPSLNVSMAINLQLPPGIDPQALTPEAQALLQGMLQQAQQDLTNDAQNAVEEALKHQAPLAGVEVALRGARWVRAD